MCMFGRILKKITIKFFNLLLQTKTKVMYQILSQDRVIATSAKPKIFDLKHMH